MFSAAQLAYSYEGFKIVLSLVEPYLYFNKNYIRVVSKTSDAMLFLCETNLKMAQILNVKTEKNIVSEDYVLQWCYIRSKTP